MANEEELVKCVQLAGRGRGLVACKPLRAGQIILRESPLLLYVSSSGALTFCGTCLRQCPSSPCPGCGSATFCSSSCRSSHSTHLCTALSRIGTAGFDPDVENQARFLLAAYHLALVSPSEFERLLHLEGDGPVDDFVRKLHYFVEGAVRSWPWSSGQGPSSLEVTCSLLIKDARNAFGYMAPTETVGQRSVRGFGVYPTASFINHGCLPNSCRFDYLDVPSDANTEIYIRALHDIPEKMEVTISYFPINWSLEERQARLAEEYGFNCMCERCIVEQNWSEDEDENTDADTLAETDRPISKIENGNDVPESTTIILNILNKKKEEEFEHAMFFVKHLCPNDECGGTMAPLSSDSARPQSEVQKDLLSNSVQGFPVQEIEKDFLSTMECNMCGHLRTGDEFRKDLQEHSMLD